MTEGTPKHGTVYTYKRKGCRCAECRAAHTADYRAYTARRKARMGVSQWAAGSGAHSGACETCGETFRSRKAEQRFCSLACHGASRREVPCTALVHVGPKVIEAPPLIATTVTTPKWWRVITNGPCDWCGETFTSTGHEARYCSKRCARGVAKSRRGFQVQPTTRRAIYKRDDWMCQLCHEPVDPDADPLSDWFPSLDHIEPQSHALIPDHSPANLRTAHRWCNAVRGDGRWHADFFESAAV